MADRRYPPSSGSMRALVALMALKRDAGRLRPAQCAGFFADFAVGVVGCEGISLALWASSRISLARMGPATEVDP